MFIRKILDESGIEINGNAPQDIRVNDDRFYETVLKEKKMGFGDAYLEGWWDAECVDETVCRLLTANVCGKIKGSPKLVFSLMAGGLFSFRGFRRRSSYADMHYNRDNELFFSFLDPFLQYNCAYFHDTDDLSEAQIKKMEMIIKKTGLKHTDTLLDIGCGWGGFARYAASRTAARITGVSISEEQTAYAKKWLEGLPAAILKTDYRNMRGGYDKVISIDMFEQVGYNNYRRFMKIIHRLLKDDGVFLLHTIGGNKSGALSNAWINKYVFPKGKVPDLSRIIRSIRGLFIVQDIENISGHFDRTLMAWHANFEKSWKELERKYNDRFYRMWRYYLLSCAGAFRAKDLQAYQIVLTRTGPTHPSCLLV